MPRQSAKGVALSLWRAFPALMAPVFLIDGILTGFATPTQLGALTAGSEIQRNPHRAPGGEPKPNRKTEVALWEGAGLLLRLAAGCLGYMTAQYVRKWTRERLYTLQAVPRFTRCE
ncbi:MAG: hypothetical protein OXN84_00165 [Albidovulum sp.]|nr:hypothetical protein [Albidovulum sp.]